MRVGRQVFRELFSSLPPSEQRPIQPLPARPHPSTSALLRVNMLAEEVAAGQTVAGEIGGER